MHLETDLTRFLTATEILDWHHPAVQDYAAKVLGDCQDPVQKAVKLYLAVRDDIRYDPYAPFYLPQHYRASYVLERGKSFCIPKAALLCALGRLAGIPSRVGFATVKNHLATRQLLEFMGTNVFVYHGFVEFYLNDKWVKATPAFNRELCERHRVAPLEFTGYEDSLFHAYNSENQKYMEYIEYYGSYEDIPVVEIVAAWEKTYGKERVQSWKQMHLDEAGRTPRDFDQEEVIAD